MKRKSPLLVALLCMVLAIVLIVPVSAHGHHGAKSRKHHNSRHTQVITVCPFDDCAESGRHLHKGVTYCSYDHESGYCDNSCTDTTVCGTGHHGNC